MSSIARSLNFDAGWDRSIVRIWIDNQPVGTAFTIGPRTALTCHHCVKAAGSSVELRVSALDGTDWIATVGEIVSPPDPEKVDVAVLRFNTDALDFLPVVAKRPDEVGELVAYGYPGAGLKQKLVRLHMELRGLKPFSYDVYSLPETLALAGDPAAQGMSGGPVIDATAGVTVAMIVAGPDFDNRTIALPLWAIDGATSSFGAFRYAELTNRRTTIQSGWAMNTNRAKQLCSQQLRNAVSKLASRQRFDESRIVRRNTLMAEIARFVSSGDTALVVTSGPSSGKTFAMAAAALELTSYSLLLDAFYVDDVRNGLGVFVQRTMVDLDAGRSDETLQQIATELKTEGRSLVIFLDGVNEIGDDLANAEGWIAGAIAEAEAIPAKLVIACRSDFWGSLEIARERIRLYDLGYFNVDEADSAAVTYGLQAKIPLELSRHPLMFKVLSSLETPSDVLTHGRFSAIRAFVRRLIKSAPGIRNPERVFAACERILRDIGPEEETINWDLAANHLGGAPVLESLIECGLFRHRDHQTVRFTFDQITEALRPLVGVELTTLMHLWTLAVDDERMATRMSASMTRAAWESEASLVSLHAEALASVFEESLSSFKGYFKVTRSDSLGSLGIVINALYLDIPSTNAPLAEDLTNRLLRMFVRFVSSHEGDYFRGHRIGAGIVNLHIPVESRFSYLCDLLALCSDDDLRDKDIFDRGRGKDLIQASEDLSSIAGALLRLSSHHPQEFLRLSIPMLDDSRRLGGRQEATVGSVLGAILRIFPPANIDSTFSLLLDNRNVRGANRLLWDLSRDYPAGALSYAISTLSSARAIAVLDHVIQPSLTALGAGRAPALLLNQLRTVMSESTLETRLSAASLIRIAEPDDLEAWDELANVALGGTGTPQLYPVPALRAASFICLLRSRGDSYAVTQMRYAYGDSRIESHMAGIAIELLKHQPHLAKELASLAEDRLYKANKSPFYSEWIELGLLVAVHDDPEIRGQLIYFAGPRSEPSELKLRIWAKILSGPVGLEIVGRAFNMVAEEGRERSDALIKQFLRPMAAEHGQPIITGLAKWVANRASVLSGMEKNLSDLNHILGLLIEALIEVQPALREKLELVSGNNINWVEYFANKV